MRRILAISILLAFATAIFPQSPKYEMRAVWLTTIGGLDWPHSYAQSRTAAKAQQEELCQLLDRYKQAGINTVLLQTRVRGTVIYPSAFEPWDGCLSGKPGVSPGYDALQFAIDQCHRRGMQLHAWVVTIPVGKWSSTGCSRLRKQFPKAITHLGQDGYMNPEQPQTADYLAKLCEEIVTKYDVDGIHLDYIRYPEEWPQVRSRRGGKNIVSTSAATRRNHITNIVRQIHHRVKALKPWIMLSCAPIGKRDDLTRYSSRGWNAYTRVHQDAVGWLEEGLMDALFPMMYFRGNHFYPFAVDWAQHAHGRIIAPGLGIYLLAPSEGNWALDIITQEMNVLRQQGLGHAYFRGRFLTDNTKGIYDFVTNTFDHTPALIPPMTWLKAEVPMTPANLNIERLTKQDGTPAVRLTWRAELSDSLFNVYSSRNWPVNTEDAHNLIATRLQSPSITFETSTDGRYFAITTLDRYGNESKPLQQAQPPHLQKNKSQTASIQSLSETLPLLQCKGKYLFLPSKPSALDADHIIIETLQGRIAVTRPYGNDEKINISTLPPGNYIVKSLNHRGITHRLGFFQKH